MRECTFISVNTGTTPVQGVEWKRILCGGVGKKVFFCIFHSILL